MKTVLWLVQAVFCSLAWSPAIPGARLKMRVLWLALLFAAAARAGVSGGASAKTSVKADVDVTWRTQDGVKNDNCTDLCIFSRDGQCDEPFLCPRGTDCDCDPEMSVTKGGVVVFNYNDVTKGAPKSPTEKYELRKSDRDKLYLGVIIVSSFMLLWLVLCASFCVNVEFIGDFALQIGLCVIFIGSIVFAAIFSGASKPFEGYGPMRKAREDLLFKPSLPLAGSAASTSAQDTTPPRGSNSMTTSTTLIFTRASRSSPSCSSRLSSSRRLDSLGSRTRTKRKRGESAAARNLTRFVARSIRVRVARRTASRARLEIKPRRV